MAIKISPLEKVVINGVDLCLGMQRSAVESAFGKGQHMGNRFYYFGSELAVDYRDDKVDFIEFLGGADGTLKPVLYGLSAFETPAEELLAVLMENNNGEIGDTARGYSYQFQNISVGVYREAVPEEVQAMIAEAAAFGNPLSDDDIRYEMKRANHWAAIGIGAAGYYQQ